jgi:hypothetical protein
MTTAEGAPSLRDAMYELSLSGSVPDPGLLDEFVRRFPEHATVLTEFAISLALDTAGEIDNQPSESASTATSPGVSKAMSRFHNRLYAVRKSTAAPVRKPDNLFASLPRAEFRALAQRLNANPVFLIKVRDRQILPSTIPLGFQRRVADELQAPIDVVVAHFAAPSEVQPRTYFKGDQKPEATGMQTFEEAVRNSELTSAQQEYLLSL